MFLYEVCIILIGTLLVLTAEAEPLCDPETQYLLNGECCLKCKPGTSMVSTGQCRDPECKACDEGEYMDKYNTEASCERQPYCDPNRNFKMSVHTSKTEQAMCLCKEGFHCSSQECLTCISHTNCKAGYGATTIGDQNHDTVCDKCPDGEFSDEVSWDGPCKKMSQCPVGLVPQNGSPESDNTCVKKVNWHIGLICAVVAFALLVGAGIFLFIYCRNKNDYAKPKQEEETFVPTQPEISMDPSGVLVTPSDGSTHFPYPSSMPHYSFLSSRPSGTPEENEEVVRTLNGHRLSQDEKEHIISQPETQGQDLISNNNELVC